MRILSFLFFIHCHVFGQIKDITNYNNNYKQLYESLNLTPFQEVDHAFHIRLNISYSTILDIWKEGDDFKGFAYYYAYQEERQVMVNDYRKVDAYVFKKEPIDDEMIKAIVTKSDSIISLDSLDIPFYYSYSCYNEPPYYRLEYKDSTAFSLLYHLNNQSLGEITASYYNKKFKEFIEQLLPGRYRGFTKFNPFPNTFTGVSAEFTSRKAQNLDLITHFGSNFGIRNNTDFTIESLRDRWPWLYKINPSH